jgi:hypothetical protein
MHDFKLKLILSVLAGIVFSFVFILLAFALPIKKDNNMMNGMKPKGKLEKISHSMQNR